MFYRPIYQRRSAIKPFLEFAIGVDRGINLAVLRHA
jgi:hypothetical protein